MSHLRILLIDNSLYPTGAIRSILNMATELKGKCTFQFVLSEKSGLIESLQAQGFKVHTLPFLEVSKSPAVIGYLPRLWANAGRLKQIIQQEQIDIVHVNDLYNQLGSMLKVRKVGVPVVYHARLLASSYIAKFYGIFAGLIKKYADHIIGVSSAVLRDIGAARSISIIYDAAPVVETLPAWDGLKSEQIRLLYIGNYVSGKGQNYGLEAFIQLHDQVPGSTLRFVGGSHSPADEQFKASLQARAKAAGVADRVIFDGPVSDIEKEAKSADIVLNLSESESFSMVCLEAMIYGVPLIASDCGGPRDITDNGEKALLVPNRDASAAAKAILKIAASRDLYAQKAAASKKWAVEKFSLQVSAQQLDTLYRQLLNRGNRK
jgi:glycosyltransferase involved in cell wall biosynthesis